jgi:hypothetical protein
LLANGLPRKPEFFKICDLAITQSLSFLRPKIAH